MVIFKIVEILIKRWHCTVLTYQNAQTDIKTLKHKQYFNLMAKGNKK